MPFYAHESEMREALGYPPYKRFAEIELKHTDEKILDRDSHYVFNHLYECAKKLLNDVQLLGPAQPPVAKIKQIFSRKIYVKAENFTDICKLIKQVDKKKYKSSIYFTPNPVA